MKFIELQVQNKACIDLMIRRRARLFTALDLSPHLWTCWTK